MDLLEPQGVPAELCPEDRRVHRQPGDAAGLYDPGAEGLRGRLGSSPDGQNSEACPGDYLYQRHGAIAEAVNAKLGTGTEQTVSSFPAVPFTVRVIINDLNYREGPGMSYAVKGQTGKGVFTITEVQDGWGKLKKNGYWIKLSYTTKVK